MRAGMLVAEAPPMQPDINAVSGGGLGRDDAFWRALLHRWFVQYNPLYLASATLVLGGLNLVSRGLVEGGSRGGLVVVALLAELYAWSLIGGAALLTRVGQRRPAVLLALLAVFYQMDLTLHTQTCAELGASGVAPAALWFGVFVAKLAALARALRVRLGGRALATATLGAAGLAILPFGVASELYPRLFGIALALFVFALGALLPRTASACVEPLDDLDAWGRTVLRRVVVATWSIWGVLLALHMAFWSFQAQIGASPVVAALFALAVVRQSQERLVWISVTATTALIASFWPEYLWVVSLLWALALGLRAFSRVGVASPAEGRAPADGPYRGAMEGEGPDATPVRVLSRVSPAERLRLLTGALAAFYLAAWTVGWQGGALPAHHGVIDALFVAAGMLMAWRLGTRLVFVPVGAVLGHGLAVSGLVPPPRSLVDWGVVALSLGFLMLFGALGVSYRLRGFSPGRAP